MVLFWTKMGKVIWFVFFFVKVENYWTKQFLPLLSFIALVNKKVLQIISFLRLTWSMLLCFFEGVILGKNIFLGLNCSRIYFRMYRILTWVKTIFISAFKQYHLKIVIGDVIYKKQLFSFLFLDNSLWLRLRLAIIRSLIQFEWMKWKIFRIPDFLEGFQKVF